MPENTVKNVLQGRSVRPATLGRVAKALNVDPSELLNTEAEIIHTILHPVFTLAVRDGYIRTNPTDGVMAEIKKSHDWKKAKRHTLTAEEQAAFIGFLSESAIYDLWLPMFTVFLGTGCRVGELIGLRWKDCDFKTLSCQSDTQVDRSNAFTDYMKSFPYCG